MPSGWCRLFSFPRANVLDAAIRFEVHRQPRRGLDVRERLQRVRGINGMRSPGSIAMAPSRPLAPGRCRRRSSCCPIRRPSRRSRTSRPEGVAGAGRDAIHPRAEAELDALAARVAEVLEVAEPDCVDETNRMSLSFSAAKKPTVQLVLAFGDVPPRTPASHGPGHDLLERRIAGHRVRQLAGQVGIRAAELDRRGRAAALAVAGVHVDGRRRAERDARGRIEPVERVIARRASRAAGPDAIAVVNAGPVVAARERQVPRAADRQRVRGVDAPGVEVPVEIDARVVRLAVDARRR